MEFNKQRFFRALLEAPKEEPILEPAEHSDYLQQQVFDKLNAGEAVKLAELDWSAFELRHVTPEGYAKPYEKLHMGWLQGINRFLRKVPAVNLNEKGFF